MTKTNPKIQDTINSFKIKCSFSSIASIIGFSFVLIGILTHQANAQTPKLQWVKSAGTPLFNAIGHSNATDLQGNVIVAGRFSGPTIAFESWSISNSGNNNSYDIFIAKYDPRGNLLWAKGIGGTSDDCAEGITTDKVGNIFITGNFSSPVLQLDTTKISNAGGTDILIIKLDALGKMIWLKGIGGNLDESGNSIATDVFGNVCITGSFGSPNVLFDKMSVKNVNGYLDFFTSKISNDGNVIWAKKGGGNADDIARGIATNSSGDVLVTGNFRSDSCQFGTFLAFNSSGNEDVFTLKYDKNGSEIWAKSGGGLKPDFGKAICTDILDNSYITGYSKSDSLSFGSNSLRNNNSDASIFVSKYDASGNELWSKRAGGDGFDRGLSITAGPENSLYVSGGFGSREMNFSNSRLVNKGYTDILLLNYDFLGNEMSALNLGSSSDDESWTVGLDKNGSIFLSGFFRSKVLTLEDKILEKIGVLDFFCAKFIE